MNYRGIKSPILDINKILLHKKTPSCNLGFMNFNQLYLYPTRWGRGSVSIVKCKWQIGLYLTNHTIYYVTKLRKWLNVDVSSGLCYLTSIFTCCIILSSCSTQRSIGLAIETNQQILIKGKDGNVSYYEKFTLDGHQYLASFYGSRPVIHLSSCNHTSHDN